VILIGSVSTLFFNANPLLRFDGYFIFSDAVELPNLAAHSNQYLGYLVQRYLFGVSQARSPANARGERVWFLTYGVAAFCYRTAVTAAIILFVSEKFFFFGVLLALWGVGAMIVLPLAKGLHFLLKSPLIQRKRVRAVTVTTGVLTTSAVFLLFVPLPLDTRAQGVVWLPEQAIVRAATDGFVRRVLKAPNSYVHKGEALIVTEDPLLPARRKVLEFRLKELEVQHDAQWVADLSKAQVVKEAITAARAEVKRAREKVDTLTIRSPSDGLFIVPRAQDLPDQWLKQGQVVAYIVQYPVTMVRAVVTQDRIGLVRQRTRSVEVRPAEQVSSAHAARVVREVPAASDELPAMALGRSGGGEIATHPGDERGNKAFETIFQFDLKIVDQENLANVGSRVFVRFDHGTEPLASQWYRKARQLFLRKYGV
jgi:putative peptide zinc metalloprotease protein